MKRVKIGPLMFVGGTLFVLAGTTGRGTAMAGAPETAQVSNVAAQPSPGKARVAPVQAATAAATTPANVGLKNASLRASGASGVAGGPGTAELGLNGTCPENMVEVEGEYCPHVEQKCLKWIDDEGVVPRRCAEFAPSGACQGKTTHKRFCIDRYEWPNKAGEKPVVMKTWYEAADACKSAGKRLCGDSEWTLACEGQERLPYPYGYQRTDACNVDKPHPDVDEKAIGNPLTRDAEVARLWQGEPSGSREACKSPYGAMDMTGNVDEWVVNESGAPYKSGLKGGYWGPVRNRCRPMTTAHYEQFSFYQIGFRCCSDAAGEQGAGQGKTPAGSNVGTGTKGGLGNAAPNTSLIGS